MSDIEKIDLEAANLVADRIASLKELFPEIATEGHGSIDFDKLRTILGEEVNDEGERYAFTWPGKAAAIRQSQTPSATTLRPLIEKSRSQSGEDGHFDSNNIYIEGDNLEVLKLLQRSYHGKVSVIYIDPPYNTGHDFIYHDDFGDTIENYKNQVGLTGQSNPDTNGRFHSDWCSMMYPRLRLARELLTEDGVIFISIDDNEAANLRAIADEVMGPSNFIAQMVWSGGRKNDSHYISVSHEYILCYAKSAQWLKEHSITWRKRKQGLEDIYSVVEQLQSRFGEDYTTMTAELKRWYRSLPDGSPAKAHSHYSSIDENGVYFPADISWPGGGGPKYEVLHPRTQKPVTIPSSGWRFSTPERMAEVIAQGRVEFGEDEKKVPCYKRYLSETETQAPYSVIYRDGRAATKRLSALMGAKVFENPKDEEIIAEILSYVDKRNSIILDFFSGSATTAHAVMSRNTEDNGKRRFILVQLPEDLDQRLKSTSKQSAKKVVEDAIRLCDSLGRSHSLCEIAEERIRRAGDKIKVEVAEANQQLKLGEEPKHLPDIGFRVFTLDESGIRRPEPGQLLADILKSDHSDLDIVFEMMLKWGLELTLPVEQSEAAGYPIWSVAHNELVCCTSDGLTLDALEEIANLQPRRVLMLDSILTDSLKLNALQVFKHASEHTGNEIELRTI